MAQGATGVHHKLAVFTLFAGLSLAQLTPPGTSNLGVPSVPGTRVPENSPATAVTPPATLPLRGAAAATSPSSDGAGAVSAPSGNSGPAYSFGAAPPPVVAPGR